MARFLLRVLAAWLIAFSIISCSPSSDTRPEWSIILYTGTDEEELAVSYDPRFRQILAAQLPPNVELITEQDTYRPDGTFRTIKRGRFDISEFSLPEHDSAAPASLADFLRWANQNARGEKRIFLVITHSWGWRGIVPGLHHSRKARHGHDDALAGDGARHAGGEVPARCHVARCLHSRQCRTRRGVQKRGAILILSQREMPYSGFPVDRLSAFWASPA